MALIGRRISDSILGLSVPSNIAFQMPDPEFRTALRRADCLFTLVAERHAIACGDHDASLHGAACAGRQKLGPAATALSSGGGLDINEYANRDEGNKKRYFKNPLGES
jgi:hypothetical protein